VRWRWLIPGRWRLRDDRGRAISAHWLEREACKSEETRAIRPIQRELHQAQGMIVGTCAGLVFVTFAGLGLGSSSWVRTMLGAAIAGAVLSSIAGLMLRPRIQRGIGRVLRHGLCGSCAYPLDGIEARDGFVVCTECGAAWRVERMGGADVSRVGAVAGPHSGGRGPGGTVEGG